MSEVDAQQETITWPHEPGRPAPGECQYKELMTKTFDEQRFLSDEQNIPVVLNSMAEILS